ncbi:glucose-6-phosphate isomerase [Nisaea acidiphila]|uniref:Glucose-6-phosphate isomerase n=1 Tax=Nisaea acidiphila TaxID=1862145 RepID=A0A9J7B2K8_9PROT|nr:glucose-6-phosphate isomerase [Nisaea acidiphila]UUX51893.1 glucose-6-phosphate isomerase [Nisaea acidiphila]
MQAFQLAAGPLRHDLSATFEDKLGDGGLSGAAFAALSGAAGASLEGLRRKKENGELPLLSLPWRMEDLELAETLSDDIRRRAADVIVLGIGGSSLGGATICRLAEKGTAFSPSAPRLHFLDNIDPATFTAIFQRVELERTVVITISKSGGTAETLCQTLILHDAFKQAGLDPARHFIAVTEPGARPLRQFAEAVGCPCLDHDPDIGGRYSGLTLNGLLPAMIVGLDAKAIRRGAAAVTGAALDASSPEESAPAAGAMVNIGLQRERGITQSVLMPYSDRLDRIGDWYTQLWAESLGKGGNGTTPIGALGAVDQHSALQLFLDGPRDKLVTIVQSDVADTGGRVGGNATELMGEGLSYLEGRTMGDLLDAEQRATAETLIANGRPTRIIRASAVDEESVGALMMHFFLETMVAADLLEVDAFNQPAVEEGKVLARRYLAEMAG